MTLCGALRGCLAVKLDSCNNLLSSVYTLLVNIMRYVRLYIRRKYYFIIYVISSLLNAPLFICLCVVLHLTSSVSVSFCFFLFLCLRIRLILSSPGSAFAIAFAFPFLCYVYPDTLLHHSVPFIPLPLYLFSSLSILPACLSTRISLFS